MDPRVALPASVRVEGYAVVSEDGMLADANGIMPNVLKIEADQRFFERKLDGVDILIHGRNSQEHHPKSSRRYRIIVTTRVAGVARDPLKKRAVLWNPSGAPLPEALVLLRAPHRSIGVLGGTSVLDRYDVFYLSCVQGVTLSGGQPVFPQCLRGVQQKFSAPTDLLVAQLNALLRISPSKPSAVIRPRRSSGRCWNCLHASRGPSFQQLLAHGLYLLEPFRYVPKNRRDTDYLACNVTERQNREFYRDA